MISYTFIQFTIISKHTNCTSTVLNNISEVCKVAYSNGPKTVPCGTPDDTALGSDKQLFTLTLCTVSESFLTN